MDDTYLQTSERQRGGICPFYNQDQSQLIPQMTNDDCVWSNGELALLNLLCINNHITYLDTVPKIRPVRTSRT
jgi:hypothetical protein